MKKFNIRIVSPLNGREVTHLDINADRLVDIDGETYFKYDGEYGYYDDDRVFHPEGRLVEVITATAITEEEAAAKAAYFEQYGTANE